MASFLRVICHQTDFGDAANTGGPAHVTHRTFDVCNSQDIADLVVWIEAGRPLSTDEWVTSAASRRWFNRAIDGVEVVVDTFEPRDDDEIPDEG